MAIWNRAAAHGLHELAARLESNPDAAWEWIERLQAARGARPQATPAQRGAVATPPEVAARMATRALAGLPRARVARVLDAGCGDGRLLAAVARAAAERGVGVECDGVEIDSTAARWAHGLEPLVRAGAGAALAGWRVRCADFLAAGPLPADIDVAIANPPYVSWRMLDRATRDRLRADAGSDLAALFVERLLDRLRPRGVLVAIVPNKLLVARYAARLRRRLRDEFDLEEIWDLSAAGVFRGHGAYPVVLVARRVRSALRRPLRVHDAAGAARAEWPRRAWAALPDAVVPLELEPRLAAIAIRLLDGPRLGDHARFACGIATSGFGRAIGAGPDRILCARDVRAFATGAGRRFDARLAGCRDEARLQTPKVIVPGMFRRLCAAWDGEGLLLGRVYWTALRGRTAAARRRERTLLLALLNSRLYALLYAGLFGAGAQSGGYLRASTTWLAALPWPHARRARDGAHADASDTAADALAACVERLERRPSAADRARLDAAVEALFGLTPADRGALDALARKLPDSDTVPHAGRGAPARRRPAAARVVAGTRYASIDYASRPRRSRVGMDVA
jgi:SAM-dependent methyltransferase